MTTHLTLVAEPEVSQDFRDAAAAWADSAAALAETIRGHLSDRRAAPEYISELTRLHKTRIDALQQALDQELADS